ncbi:MAG: hypothetical protein KF752_20870 [Pirellulaceae bacterium]|nr:hypothetical protein [Pirellulaceae bacterium]
MHHHLMRELPKCGRRVPCRLWMLSLLAFSSLIGCRSTAPIHVWRPGKVSAQPHARIALAPVVASPELAAAIEAVMLTQRTTARSDLAVLTTQQLLDASPVRLASTMPLSNDLTALTAARAAGADILLHGEVCSCNIDLTGDVAKPEESSPNMNQVFFQRLGIQLQPDAGFHILMSWNVLDVSSGKSLASQQFRLDSRQATELYPDLNALAGQPANQLLTAAARESWKSIVPSVQKDWVRLSSPWIQPAAWRVQRGNRAAQLGQWEMAEYHWRKGTNWWLPTPAAHHNLAIAMAAREDFPAAKLELRKARGPLSWRLPAETMIWLDYNQRMYHRAHQLENPPEGWVYPAPEDLPSTAPSVPLIDERKLPWFSLGPYRP